MGIDYVPAAIEAAQHKASNGVTYVVGDATDLAAAGLGTFDFFLDVGCFQGFDAEQRQAVGRGVTALANPEATLLMLAFGPTRMRPLEGGVSQARWKRHSRAGDARCRPRGHRRAGLADEQDTPHWYRLRRRTSNEGAR